MTKRTGRARAPRPPTVPGLRADEFPALTSFVQGYLHQDFPEVHGSVAAAAAAFCTDAGVEERRQLAEELEALVHATSGRSPRHVRRFVVGDLGSGWTPASRDDLLALLDVIRPPV